MPDEIVYLKKIRSILQTTPELDANSILNCIIDAFYMDIVTANDQALFDIAFSGADKVTQTQLDDFLRTWDIEVAGGAKSIMIAYLQKQRQDLRFSEYEGPRLKGLMKFYRFQNLDLMSHFTKIVKSFNANGILPLVLKGGAMKFLRPDMPRVMSDIDILVRDINEYHTAAKLATDLGYEHEPLTAESHGVDLLLPGTQTAVLDIHEFLDFGNIYDHAFTLKLFSRAEKKRIFGVEAYIPSLEDMVFISLLNMTKNLRESSSVKGILYTLFDFAYLSSLKSLDWNIILDSVFATGTQVQMYIAMRFANRIVPGLLPVELLENPKLKKEIFHFINKELFCDFADRLKIENNSLTLKESLRSWEGFKHYFSVCPRHFFIKKIRKRPHATELFTRITDGLIKWNKVKI